jgi:hypothetical protein
VTLTYLRLTFAVQSKAVQRLQALDGRVEQRMADHPKLQKLDTFLQNVIGRLHAWLGSTG